MGFLLVTAARRAALALLLLWGSAGGAGAQDDSRALFERYAGWVVQIRILEAGSGSKRGLGSGFVSGPDGEVVTNYHVVSELLLHPERYRGELVDDAGASHPVRVIAFDVVNDLAVLSSPRAFDGHFALNGATLHKGDRVYSVGDPYDLGMSIVEGTYNGLLEHSRYEKIHFTGSLNPGMSGGPALRANGAVVGVNVATAGNQISFLVPVARVRELLAQVRAPDFEPMDDPTAELRRQLLEYQESYVADLLDRPFGTVRLGPYSAPTEPAPYFSCWGDTTHADDDLYESRVHECFTEDRVFVSEDHNFAIVRFRHRQLQSRGLSPSRFYELYTSYFEGNYSQLVGSEDDLTPFRCRTRFVTNGTLPLKATFCVRRYRALDGLYDAVFKAAALGRENAGLETALVMASVSFENAERLARRYLEALQWGE